MGATNMSATCCVETTTLKQTDVQKKDMLVWRQSKNELTSLFSAKLLRYMLWCDHMGHTLGQEFGAKHSVKTFWDEALA